MSEVGFTKGPWRRGFNNIGHVTAENGAVIAKCHRLTSLCNLQANAHLIAAAPDLYEALETLTEMARRMNFSEGVCCCGDSVEGHGFGSGHSPVDAGLYYATEAIETARAALTKARGETT